MLCTYFLLCPSRELHLMVQLENAERFVIEAIPENLFRSPLDYLTTDHVRQEALCGHFEHMASGAEAVWNESVIGVLRTFLARDLMHHIADETDLLFPRLRLRCCAGDDIEPVLTQVGRDHAMDELLIAGLIDALDMSAAEGGRSSDRVARIGIKLIESLRDHLRIENTDILPFARRRLTPQDLETIGRSMAARRGADYPG